jgi:hypothetical protein
MWLITGTLLFQLEPYRSLSVMTPGLSLLDMRMGYTDIDVITYLAVLGESGRQLYRLFLLADFGNAILTAAAFTMMLVFLVDRLGLSQRPIAVVVLLPAVAMALDLVENLTLLGALKRFPDIPVAWMAIGSASTMAKLLVTAIGGIAVLLAVTAWGLSLFRLRPASGEG